jgi:hypothetical protein
MHACGSPGRPYACSTATLTDTPADAVAVANGFDLTALLAAAQQRLHSRACLPVGADAGESTRGKGVFVNNEFQPEWMLAGGARKIGRAGAVGSEEPRLCERGCPGA